MWWWSNRRWSCCCQSSLLLTIRSLFLHLCINGFLGNLRLVSRRYHELCDCVYSLCFSSMTDYRTSCSIRKFSGRKSRSMSFSPENTSWTWCVSYIHLQDLHTNSVSLKVLWSYLHVCRSNAFLNAFLERSTQFYQDKFQRDGVNLITSAR